MGSTPVAAESGSDLRFGLLEEGRPRPPVAAAALVGGAQPRRNPTPPWLRAIRWYCVIAATAMVAFFAAEVFPRCKGKQDVLLCVVALAGAVFTGPILGFALTTCADDADADADDHEAARVASPYTRCEENVGRSVILAVALLGLYAIYLAALGCGGDVDRFLLAANYGVMGVGVIVGHSVSWIMGCFLRRD